MVYYIGSIKKNEGNGHIKSNKIYILYTLFFVEICQILWYNSKQLQIYMQPII